MGLASGRVSRVFGPLAIARLGQALSLRQSWEPGYSPVIIKNNKLNSLQPRPKTIKEERRNRLLSLTCSVTQRAKKKPPKGREPQIGKRSR